MFTILNNVPAIHATIVGILMAFFSAFFIYAYQQVSEAKKKLEKAQKLAKSASTLTSFTITSNLSFLDENGDFDWNGKGKSLINEAKSVFYIQNTNNPGDGQEQFNNNVDSEYILEIVDKLIPFFYHFFSSYPLNGYAFVRSENYCSTNNNEEFNSQRYYEVQRRISYLSWVWDTSKNSLIHLFNCYDEIKRLKVQIKMEYQWEVKKAELLRNDVTDQDVIDGEKEIIESRFSFPEEKTIGRLIDFFDRVKFYESQVMPILSDSIYDFETYNNELQVKKITKIAIGITIYIIVVGILLPLIFQKFLLENSEYNTCSIFIYSEYIILILSFLPYFFILGLILRKINSSFFK